MRKLGTRGNWIEGLRDGEGDGERGVAGLRRDNEAKRGGSHD